MIKTYSYEFQKQTKLKDWFEHQNSYYFKEEGSGNGWKGHDGVGEEGSFWWLHAASVTVAILSICGLLQLLAVCPAQAWTRKIYKSEQSVGSSVINIEFPCRAPDSRWEEISI